MTFSNLPTDWERKLMELRALRCSLAELKPAIYRVGDKVRRVANELRDLDSKIKKRDRF